MRHGVNAWDAALSKSPGKSVDDLQSYGSAISLSVSFMILFGSAMLCSVCRYEQTISLSEEPLGEKSPRPVDMHTYGSFAEYSK